MMTLCFSSIMLTITYNLLKKPENRRSLQWKDMEAERRKGIAASFVQFTERLMVGNDSYTYMVIGKIVLLK